MTTANSQTLFAAQNPHPRMI